VSESILNGTSAQLGYTLRHSRWFTLENTGQKIKFKKNKKYTN